MEKSKNWLKKKGLEQIYKMLKVRAYHKSCYSSPYKKEIEDIAPKDYIHQTPNTTNPMSAMAGAFLVCSVVGVILFFGGIATMFNQANSGIFSIELLISPVAIILGLYLSALAISLGASVTLNLICEIKSML